MGGAVSTSLPVHDGIFTWHPGDDSFGYFVQPTVILTKDPKSVTMVEEIFGPVLTVGVIVQCPLPLTDITPGLRFRGLRL